MYFKISTFVNNAYFFYLATLGKVVTKTRYEDVWEEGVSNRVGEKEGRLQFRLEMASKERTPVG